MKYETYENSVPSEPVCPCVALWQEASKIDQPQQNRCYTLNEAYKLCRQFCTNPNCLHPIKTQALRIEIACLEGDLDHARRTGHDPDETDYEEEEQVIRKAKQRLEIARNGYTK